VSHAGGEWAGIGSFREFIQEYSRRKGWNQREFAEAAGVDSSVVGRWLRGRIPRPDMIRRMAGHLAGDYNVLLAIAGYRDETDEDLTPEQAELIAKIRQIRLSKDRFLILDAMLDDMRRRDPEK
jgi:transcriptional regulator with XRE-family HTH domain